MSVSLFSSFTFPSISFFSWIVNQLLSWQEFQLDQNLHTFSPFLFAIYCTEQFCWHQRPFQKSYSLLYASLENLRSIEPSLRSTETSYFFLCQFLFLSHSVSLRRSFHVFSRHTVFKFFYFFISPGAFTWGERRDSPPRRYIEKVQYRSRYKHPPPHPLPPPNRNDITKNDSLNCLFWYWKPSIIVTKITGTYHLIFKKIHNKFKKKLLTAKKRKAGANVDVHYQLWQRDVGCIGFIQNCSLTKKICFPSFSRQIFQMYCVFIIICIFIEFCNYDEQCLGRQIMPKEIYAFH